MRMRATAGCALSGRSRGAFAGGGDGSWPPAYGRACPSSRRGAVGHEIPTSLLPSLLTRNARGLRPPPLAAARIAAGRVGLRRALGARRPGRPCRRPKVSVEPTRLRRRWRRSPATTERLFLLLADATRRHHKGLSVVTGETAEGGLTTWHASAERSRRARPRPAAAMCSARSSE